MGGVCGWVVEGGCCISGGARGGVCRDRLHASANPAQPLLGEPNKSKLAKGCWRLGGLHCIGAIPVLPPPVASAGGLEWEDVVSRPFVDVARSPALARAFYIPGWSPRQNHYVEYVLLRRRQAT